MVYMFQFFQILHSLGIAWGLGGATIAYIGMRTGQKDPQFGQAWAKFMPTISKIIWVALISLMVSGVGLLVLHPPSVAYSAAMWGIKHVVVYFIIAAGILITFVLGPKIKRLAPQDGAKPSPEFLKVRKIVQLLGLINLVCWYVVVALSVFIRV